MIWEESEYRRKVQETLARIEASFTSVDPDIAECEVSLGAMTVTLADGSRVILSMQPSVRQLWLALAAKGTAYHFNFDPKQQLWLDDKGRGVELMGFVKAYFQESCKISLNLG